METNNTKNLAPKIIVQFPIIGKQLPADHGYLLYSAISRFKPELHDLPADAKWLGIELISGVPFDRGIIALPTRGANLRLRIPADKFGNVMDLSGKQLEIGDKHKIRLGIGYAFPIQPAPTLYARIVTFRNALTIEKFLETARHDLTEKLAITATLEIPKETHSRHRRIITIKGKKVVGFSLIARDLSDEDSVKLRSEGLGGRRAMGCGIFNPILKPSDFEGGNNAV